MRKVMGTKCLWVVECTFGKYDWYAIADGLFTHKPSAMNYMRRIRPTLDENVRIRVSKYVRKP